MTGEDRGKNSYSVHARVNLGQYIHHTFFGSPPESKLDVMPIHDSSNVIDIIEREKKLKSSKLFSIKTEQTYFSQDFSKIGAEGILNLKLL